ncbi:PTS galactitol transporter subunit IIB [Corynebacterium sp. HMSC056F09]|uniref:PTS galactitol transporter subunit IIB n=1 Tax=Corynebacterium TaxID=1716 RepID=UPI000664FCA5|nr:MULTISPECIES: PTS galactitol transporter subunit IIB [Corynebacterium]OFL20627.1 PTS galactitol transporter subunit IIB [Corynebacterium sp. HMSC062A03]OFN75681.1 PTS galactitol transporter subunit IIB [Corynebacterium sp. HMSC074E01]OFO22228.1 PTS galactitol transporter subunit IIB [Corynebacterium sp. HMSC056F09]
MSKKNIIVACGGAVATSTMAADRIRELCKENGIEADVSQNRISELGSVASTADLIVTTAKVDRDYGVPVVHGIAFVSGINVEVTEQKILDVLKG